MSEHKLKEKRQSQDQFKEYLKQLFDNSDKEKLSKKIIWGTLSVAVFVVYLNALSNSFVWDDVDSIQNSPLLHSVGNIPQIFSIVMNLIYRPLTYSSFAFVYDFFGSSPFYFHFLNVMAHFGTTILVFYILKRFFNERLALLLSLFFAVHPINVEAVTWISAFSEVSYVFYGLLSFLFALRVIDRENKWLNLSLMALFGLFSYFSKESAIIISLTILLYSHLYSIKTVRIFALFQLIPFLSYSIIRFTLTSTEFLESFEKSIVPIQNLSLSERLLHIPKILIFYITTFFFPLNLKTQQNWVIKEINFNNFILPSLFLILIVLLIFYLTIIIKNKYKELLKPWLFFTGLITIWSVLHIQILPLTMTVAERWFYFGEIGILGMIGILMSIFVKYNIKPKFLFFSLIVVLLLLSFQTIRRNFEWKNNFSLYSSDYRNEDINPYLENGLGSVLFNSGKFDEAYPYFKRSTELQPSGWKNWTNLGLYYQEKENYEKASESYAKALSNKRSFAPASVKLSSLLLDAGMLDDAEKVAIEGLKYNPNNTDLLRTYALILFQKGDFKEALKEIRRAYSLSPSKLNKSALEIIEKGEY